MTVCPFQKILQPLFFSYFKTLITFVYRLRFNRFLHSSSVAFSNTYSNIWAILRQQLKEGGGPLHCHLPATQAAKVFIFCTEVKVRKLSEKKKLGSKY